MMLSKNYEDIIDKFLKNWRNKRFVEGAFLTESTVTSFFSEYSDLDIYIVLSPGTKWRERGNVIIDNVLVEYFANPVEQIRKYFQEDFQRNRKTMARMLVMGKIMFDRNGLVKELKEEAKKWINKKFKKPSKIEIELMKYRIWDEFQNLMDLYIRKDEGFVLLFHKLLLQILENYSKYLCTEIPPVSKLVRFFMDSKFREEYMYEKFPDDKFSELFLNCIKARSQKEMIISMENLVSYILEKMGGFEINGWKVRTPIHII